MDSADVGLISLLGINLWQRMSEPARERMRKLFSKRMINTPEYRHLKRGQQP